ncbi:CoA pyrophosphatase [Blastococcus sp. Marseille-P5729]|uniref:NUDIX hydrolase n=1 Tax=Blastococcus sp. Marseille-P5729 TaxID=2086582 RepID=UPI0018FE111D|nr:CoA pyrophosphatase [Blastococcus sp. Marseille-P5729]
MTPEWLTSMRSRLQADPPLWFSEHPVPASPRRSSAVLVLFGPGADGRPELVLTERAHHLRSHGAQVVFPGGHLEPGETPVQAALRESNEEIGLDQSSVEIVDVLPAVYLTPQSMAYVPVLGWWREPHPVDVVDPDEVRRIVIPAAEDLAAPENRFTATAPGGYRGPGFFADDLIVWGVTANLLASVLELAGMARPWDESVTHPLPHRLLAPYGWEAVTPDTDETQTRR